MNFHWGVTDAFSLWRKTSKGPNSTYSSTMMSVKVETSLRGPVCGNANSKNNSTSGTLLETEQGMCEFAFASWFTWYSNHEFQYKHKSTVWWGSTEQGSHTPKRRSVFLEMEHVGALTFGSFDWHAVYKHQVAVGYLAHETRSFKKRLKKTYGRSVERVPLFFLWVLVTVNATMTRLTSAISLWLSSRLLRTTWISLQLAELLLHLSSSLPFPSPFTLRRPK